MSSDSYPALGFDPAPGDSGNVDSLAARTKKAADALDNAQNSIKRLPDLPFYVSLLSKSAHDLTVSSGAEASSESGSDSGDEARNTIADHVRADFG